MAIVNRDAFREILQMNKDLEAQKQHLLEEKKELKRKNKEIEALSRLAQALASTLDVGEVLTHLTKSIHETLSFDRIVVGPSRIKTICAKRPRLPLPPGTTLVKAA